MTGVKSFIEHALSFNLINVEIHLRLKVTKLHHQIKYLKMTSTIALAYFTVVIITAVKSFRAHSLP